MLTVDIHKTLGRFRLRLAFEHRRGILILFGRSGAGKTTALRAIAGIEKPDGGRVAFGGRTLFCSETGVNVSLQHRRIGFLFQQHNLFPHMTAYENIAYAARDRGEIGRWLRLFHVEHTVDRYPRHLSGGEQQRVAIIRALCTHPRLLLMDEPLSAVDVATRTRLVSELRELQRQTGVPMVHVTHDVSEAFRLGDRVIVLESGRVIHDGLPIEVFHAPTTVALASLSGTENILTGCVTAHHPDDGTTELAVGDVTLFAPTCFQSEGEAVTVAIRPEDILIATRPVEASSARNQLAGDIVEIEQDTLPAIRVRVSGGVTLRARITRRSLESLALQAGKRVWLLMKAWTVHPIDPDASPTAAGGALVSQAERDG